MVRISDIQNGVVLWATVPFCHISQNEIETYLLQKDDILFARTGGTVGKSFLVKDVPYPSIYAGYLIRTRYSRYLSSQYMKYFMESQLYWEQLRNGTIATAQPNCNGKTLAKMILPIPPFNEQVRITEKLNHVLEHVEKYGASQEKLNNLNTHIKELLKKAILQDAIQGHLVPQEPNDEPASILLQRIKEEKLRLVKEGRLRKKDVVDSIIFKGDDNRYYEKVNGDTKCIDDEIPFDIPESWRWIRLSNISIVARGGSPRPIKEYITESSNGVNWIKIGDSEKGGKYINKCAEKIKPEGVSKSRLVKPGDFLLTNSMSFGRPYITNVEGCIHDGWLVISQFIPVYNTDFLFFLLSSPFAYGQFSGKTAGAVVQNLNKDKVADSFFPLPPIQEQKRIVAIMERLIKEL